MIHCSWPLDAPRSALMAGSATTTMNESRIAMNVPTITMATARHGVGEDVG
ncbi:hypothetical protein ACQP1V_32530 [Microtetraspora malaysiensis]|uniref:hypothetical protein n=1 Tax=Microtetraspora malaysiensis TaxID=161358 RepID=UPI003D927161